MNGSIRFEGLDRMNQAVTTHVPQAVTWALNWTAFAARALVNNALPKTFTVRSTWVQRGFRILKAHKRDFGTLKHEAAFANTRPFMDFHVIGGRRFKTGGDGTIVPVAARPMKLLKLKRGQMPNAVFKRRISANDTADQINAGRKPGFKWYAVDVPGGDVAIFRRINDRYSEHWWTIRDDVHIPQRWPFDQQVQRMARERLQKNFNRAMDRALRTAR